MRRLLTTSLAVLFAAAPVSAAGPQPADSTSTQVGLRSELLYSNSVVGSEFTNQSPVNSTASRSIPLALGLSLAVPGVGQAYNGQYWKTALFVGIEAALITGYAVWKRDGNDGVDNYEAYARQNWSPLAYAEWLNAYPGYGGEPIPLPSLTEADFRDPGSWTANQQSEVRQFFDAIRAAEERSIYLTTGAGFSHVLPYFGEQQYYELIGKYFQYSPGWSDYTANPTVDPEEATADESQFFYYADIHADANDKLRYASRVGSFVLLNHVLSGIEAAISAKLHNDRIRTDVTILLDANGEPIATARIAVRL